MIPGIFRIRKNTLEARMVVRASSSKSLITLLLLWRDLNLAHVLVGVRIRLVASQIDLADRSGDGITIGLPPVDQRLIGAAKASKEQISQFNSRPYLGIISLAN